MSRMLSARSKHIAQLTASLESIDDAVAPAELAPPTNDLDGQLVEMNDASGDVDDASDAADELEEVRDGLESIALSLESAMKEGGLTPQAANFANQAIAGNLRRVGVTRPKTVSLESFGGESTRLEATRVSLESAKEWIDKIVAALKAAWAAVTKAVTTFFAHLFNTAPRLKAAAVKLRAQAKGMTGAPKEAEFELGNLASRIAVDGTIPSDAVAGLKEVQEVVQGIGESHYEASFKFTADISTFIEGLASAGEAGYEGHLKEVFKVAAPVPKVLSVQGKETDGYREMKSKPLPGDRVIVARVPVPQSTDAEAYIRKSLGGIAMSVQATAGKDVDTKSKFKTLSASEIDDLLAVVMEICDDAMANKAVIEKGRREADAAVAKLSEDNLAKVDDKHKGSFQALLGAYSRALTNVDRAPAVILGYAINAAKDFASLADRSVKAHGGEKVAAAAGDKKDDKPAAAPAAAAPAAAPPAAAAA